MESINIVTGQFVTIKYESANVIRRGAALLLDGLVMLAYSYFFGYLFSQLGDFFRTNYFGVNNFFTFVFLSPLLFYHLLFESLTGGQTPGKMLTGIRVVNTDGSSPGFLSYFLRWLLLPIDLLPSGVGVGLLFIAFTSRHQRLGDMAAGTIVVKTAKPIELNLERDFMEYTDDYQPLFPQVELLSDGQIRFINKILFDLRDLKTTSASVSSLAAKVKETMNVESTLSDRDFLETVIRDYNYYAIQTG